MTDKLEDPLAGAVRFAEEYGYNRWQEARDERTRLLRIAEAAERVLEEADDVSREAKVELRAALSGKEEG